MEREEPQRNFKTLGTKLPRHEAVPIETYCKSKGTTPSKLIRDLLIRETNAPVPNNVAGKNIITYNKDTDTFSWGVLLDNGKNVEVIANMSPHYLESLQENMNLALEQRNSVISKKRPGSVAVPTELVRKGI